MARDGSLQVSFLQVSLMNESSTPRALPPRQRPLLVRLRLAHRPSIAFREKRQGTTQ